MRTLLTALALVPCALGAAACGGSDEEEGSGGPPATFERGQTVAVKGSEYKFEPGNVVVRGGGSVRIELQNTGSLAHNLRVFRGGSDIGGTPTFTGGETESSSVRLEPGEYEMVCTVGDHADLGMKGKLTVR